MTPAAMPMAAPMGVPMGAPMGVPMAAPAPAPAPMPMPEPVSGPESMDELTEGMPENIRGVLGSIFNPDAMAERERLEQEEAQQSETAQEEEYQAQYVPLEKITAQQEAEDAPFDIMALLSEEAEHLSGSSPIDMMDDYGEDVIEVTLEDLLHYAKLHGMV